MVATAKMEDLVGEEAPVFSMDVDWLMTRREGNSGFGFCGDISAPK
jgi:hypothetical protein